MMKFTYGFGLNTVSAGEEAKKFESATDCAKRAAVEGYGFIMRYSQSGDKTIIAWNARVVSKDEALELYMCDGDKRTILNSSRAQVWIILPVEGYSDILIAFGENHVRAFHAVKLDELV